MLKVVKPFFGGSYKKLVPVLKSLLVSVATSISDSAGDSDMTSLDSIASFRQEVESMMDAKLEELSPQAVKALLADIVREHLGWLVVWGNVFWRHDRRHHPCCPSCLFIMKVRAHLAVSGHLQRRRTHARRWACCSYECFSLFYLPLISLSFHRQPDRRPFVGKRRTANR